MILMMVGCLGGLMSTGCGQLRLPAIDPTGSRIFAPLPTTTTLALPGSDGSCLNCLERIGDCNCLSRLGSCLTRPALTFPTPAFEPAEDPTTCPAPSDNTGRVGGGICGAGQHGDQEPCVASASCGGSCSSGPRAVLLGTQTDCGNQQCGLPSCLGCRKMPDRGKRGCILLTPQKIVAPVGGEVVLLSGICGTDGYLQVNEPLEWMIAPDSVGNIIAVGDDEIGLVGRLVGSKIRPEKRDPSYAIGVTSTKKALITRGNHDPADDIRLEKGQTWLTLSSPSEGVSHVTVLAPQSECWDQRKATATIYWVDATWTFPSSQIVPVNTPVELNTRVNRAAGGLPAAGWVVRYEIQDASLATFAGTDGANVVDVKVDQDGNAKASLIPNPGTGGTTAVNMTIVRPAGLNDNLPKLELGSGQTFVTWSAPGLALRAAGPATASFETPFEVVANLSNPGDQAATNVRVDLQIPPGVEVIRADSFATVTPSNVIWEIGSLPAQSQLDLFVTLSAKNSATYDFAARGDGLAANDGARVDVFRPSLALKVEPVDASVPAGEPARFNVDITNTGQRPITDVTWVATGDASMLHEGGDVDATNTRQTPLNPGETWGVVMTFVPNTAGRRCINVVATAAGGQRADQQSCITAINPIPRAPRLSVTLEQRGSTFVGATEELYRMVVRNQGDAAATRVRSTMAFDRQFQLISATEGYEISPDLIGGVGWTVQSLAPGEQQVLEVLLRPVEASPSARITGRATSDEGSSDQSTIAIAIDPLRSPSDRGPLGGPSTPLPPSVAPPTIPGGPAPLQGAPLGSSSPLGGGSAGPTPRGQNVSGRLRASLVPAGNPVRVGQPIRYSFTVENDTLQNDGEIDVQFELPDGVAVERVVPTTNPELASFEVKSGKVLLALIRNLRPGESVEYILQLVSNQPQTYDLNIEVASQNQPEPVIATATTTVIP